MEIRHDAKLCGNAAQNLRPCLETGDAIAPTIVGALLDPKVWRNMGQGDAAALRLQQHEDEFRLGCQAVKSRHLIGMLVDA